MDNVEKLMASRPEIKIKLMRMPKGMPGYIKGNRIYLEKKDNSREQYEVLLEEIAHFDKTVGDIHEQKTPSDWSQERQARSIAYEKAVPLKGLIYCMQNSICLLSEVADYFNVTEKFLYEAIDNYRSKLGVAFKFDGYLFDLRKGVQLTKIKK